MKKKFIFYIIGIIWLIFGGIYISSQVHAQTNIVSNSNFDRFVKQLNKDSVVYNPENIGIKPSSSLKDNIINIFYPSKLVWWWKIYNLVRNIWVGILVVFIILNGMYLVRFADNEKELDKAKMNFLYMWYGAFLVFAAVRLLNLINIWWDTWWIWDLLDDVQNSLLFQVLTFLKAAAFFLAILMIVYHGLQIIRAYEKEDKLKEWKNGVINVLAALIFIKVIDYVFYIAQQSNFKSQAIELIVSASKIIWRILGAICILYVIYAGFQMITSQWDEANYKKAVSTLRAILLVWITIMLFLLITYQLFTDVFA